MRITIIGTGYVGLVTGAGLAETGNDVTCVDIDEERLAALRKGRSPFFEPGLADLMGSNTERLSYTGDLGKALSKKPDLVFLCVGTPMSEDGSADLGHIFDAARSVARTLFASANHGDGAFWAPSAVVIKSTVPPGTCEAVQDDMAEITQDFRPIPVASNPEFLKEGSAVTDFLRPDVVVVGTDDGKARRTLEALYRPYMRTHDRFMAMDRRSAEMSKYALNGKLAARISYMNEIANLCDAVGADVEKVRNVVGGDRRIGPSFLFPGVGFGGSCFPKDVAALCTVAEANGGSMRLLKATLAVNAEQRTRLVTKLVDLFKSLEGRTVALWGLSFKPGTDDVREAPALATIEALAGLGVAIAAHDPKALDTARKALTDKDVGAFGVRFEQDMYDAVAGADALMVMTEWPVYRNPDFDRLYQVMEHPFVLDGRNLYDPATMRTRGFTYAGIGR